MLLVVAQFPQFLFRNTVLFEILAQPIAREFDYVGELGTPNNCFSSAFDEPDGSPLFGVPIAQFPRLVARKDLL